MGLHTWFYKDKKLYTEMINLYKKLDDHDNNISYLDKFEINKINIRLSSIDKSNNSNYHDVFRTWKRNENGTYTDDVIYSKKECEKWIYDNVKYISPDINDKLFDNVWIELNEFWDNHPNGVIDFG